MDNASEYNASDYNASEYILSRESTSSLSVPLHRYNLRNLPIRRRSTTDTSTLNFSALSNNSVLRLARQHAQPLSSDKHSSELVAQSYFTFGLDTDSLLSSDVQTAFLSGNLISEVLKPTPVLSERLLVLVVTALSLFPSPSTEAN